MVVRVSDFPQDLTPPVHLRYNAALPASPAWEAIQVLQHLARVEKVAVVQQAAIESGRVGHVPLVDNMAIHVDEVDFSVAVHGGEKGVTVLAEVGVVGAKPDTVAAHLDGVNVGHGVVFQ